MANDNKIKDEKLKYDTNREAAKISALSPGKSDKQDFLQFIFLPLGKRFKKVIKTIETNQNIKSHKTRRKSGL